MTQILSLNIYSVELEWVNKYAIKILTHRLYHYLPPHMSLKYLGFKQISHVLIIDFLFLEAFDVNIMILFSINNMPDYRDIRLN